MIIKSGNDVLAYNASSRIALQQQGGDIMKPELTAPAKNADQVTLSNVGKALAVDESNTAQPRTLAQEKLIMAASSDRESAEKIAQDMAYTPSTIFYDLSGVGGGEEVKKLSTSGRIIDDQFKSKFNSESSVIDAQRRAIYEAEKSKRTDPLLILSKMIDFTNSQSQDYLEASGWGYQHA